MIMINKIKNLKPNETINIAYGLLPCDYGWENCSYETLTLDLSYEDNKYVIWEYLENQNGIIGEPNYRQSFDTIEELIEVFKDEIL